MTSDQFEKMADKHNLHGSWREAAKLVLVNNVMPAEAARKLNINRATVSRALKKLERPVCKTCKRPL